ncbi:TlpA family protein disulfide reductase [Natronobiforma cellulositropha]|uniref:TlpA family protein disulfide reductase n=1 Tax=Natronobiforma cellulositropha TaxID=1679076 RepID=UPI0021D5DB73|nr:TlpA family protein disulfide reductase [Natronobiforma cellulositropha]
MGRRELLAGGVALAGVAAGGAFALGGWNPLEREGDVPAFDLESLEAPGSAAGTITVPERGRVTVLELFATWCGVCAELMVPLGTVYDEFGADVQFVSVTNEPLGRTITREDVASWWADHDGRWSLAHDADLELTSALEATSVPYSVVLDETNAVVWAESGYKSVEALRAPITAALEG